jgi:putative resolvase
MSSQDNKLSKPSYVSGKTAKELLQCSDSTLRRWANEGKIDYTRHSKGGKRFYNINKFITNVDSSIETSNFRREICYCRVSSKHQKEDLQRQIEFMQQKFPHAEIISDIGSGINWKRRGLQSMLRKIKDEQVERIIINYKDRLCRFAFELIEFFCNLYKVEILVLDSSKEEPNSDAELADDILSIIHVFSCKKMGQRRYKIKE